MLKIKYLATVVSCTLAAHSYASLNIQPDPQNPNGYLAEKSALQAAEQAKTSDPMYAIWSQALQTRPNSIVEAIEPGLASNPENVKRVERVFPQSEWDFLTRWLRQNTHTLASYVRLVNSQPSVESTPMAVTPMPSVKNPLSRPLLISRKRRAATSR